MWRAAGRRFVGLLALASAITVVVSILLGLVLDASLSRAISLGFYVMGSFLLVSGFFVGNRGPVRLKTTGAGGDPGGPFLFGSRFVRWANPSEREETINLSAIFITLGFVLILVGVAADNRYNLV
jgi:hypothetical protein